MPTLSYHVQKYLSTCRLASCIESMFFILCPLLRVFIEEIAFKGSQTLKCLAGKGDTNIRVSPFMQSSSPIIGSHCWGRSRIDKLAQEIE